MLVLPTGNLIFETCDHSLTRSDHAVFERGDHGWLVFVGEPGDDFAADVCARMVIARENQCRWIIFDRDVELFAQLQNYDW